MGGRGVKELTSARFIAGVVATVAMLSLVGCGRRGPSPEVKRVWIDRPAAHFGAPYVELVPPVALPSNHEGHPQVSIRAALSPGAEIRLVPGPDGEEVLEFPAGTRMERLEFVESGKRRSLADVRGAVIDAEGRIWHHNYRRTALRPGAPLVGYTWPADDQAAHDVAVDRLVEEVTDLPPAASMDGRRREGYLQRIRSMADCADCHVPKRPRNHVAGEHGLVNRATDASTFFTPQTVFASEVVLEDYGRFDPNLDAPFVRLSCADGTRPQRFMRTTGRRGAACTHGLVTAHFDLPAALKAGDARAKRVCASRLALAEHLDTRALIKFERAIRMCESFEAKIKKHPEK